MKNKSRKIIILVFLSVLIWNRAHSQTSPFSVNADLMSRYIWRGLDLGGGSPSIQPSMKYTIISDSSHCLQAGMWSAFSLSNTANDEVDISMTYTYHNFLSFMITDYFFPKLNAGTKDKYFEYSPELTGHVFEGALSFNGTEKIPFTFLAAMNFYGNDSRRINSDFTAGKIMYSKYIELGYKRRVQDVDVTLFVGGALDKANNENESTFYLNEKASVINIGCKFSKSLKITNDYSMPLQCSLIANPELNKMYVAFGITL